MEAKTHLPTTEESAIVERVLRIVSSVRGVKPDYARLAAELEPAIPFDVFGVALLRHDHEAVRIIACERRAGSWFSDYRQHPLQGSKVELLLQQISSTPVVEPQPTITNYPNGLDGLPAECGDALSTYPQLRAIFIAPLVVEGRLLGTLELGSTGLHTYDEEPLRRLIEGVVRVIATAIDGAQTGGSVEIQNRQRQALRDVSSALNSTTDLSLILKKIVEGVVQALHVASAIILLNQREGILHVEAQQGLDDKVFKQLIHDKAMLSKNSIIGYTLQTQQPCASQDIAVDTRFPQNRPFASKLDIHSIYCYPLVTGNTVYGALLLCSHEPGGFTPLKIEILSLFASQTTIAIHNGLLVQSASQRHRFQMAIEQLEQAHVDRDNEREVFEQVRRETESAFGIRFSSLLLYISDSLLTRSERDLYAMLNSARHDEYNARHEHTERYFAPYGEGMQEEQAFAPLSQKESMALLTQTAETALARAGAMSELGGLFMQLQQTTGHANDAWFVTDPFGYYLFMNSSAERFCGMHSDSLRVDRDLTIEDIFANLLPRIRNVDNVRSYLAEFVQDGQGHRQTLRCVIAIDAESLKSVKSMKDTTTYQSAKSLSAIVATDQHYQFTRHPLYNQQGVLVGRALQVHDVTAQVHDEHNKLTLLSSVSHDLRSPLTTIKAAVSGLMETNVTWDEDTYREILEDINAESDHLERLVTDLIEMSRIEMGALVLEKEWCDILEVIHGALAHLERVVDERRIVFHTGSGFQSVLPLIFADRVHLERAFFYIMEFVAHDTEDTVAMLVDVESFENEEGAYLCVRVFDQGKVIPKQERERLFKTFYHPSTHGNGRAYGTGLGLAICRGIVDAHRGQIYVEAVSDSTTWTCFTCLLPLHVPHEGSMEHYSLATHPPHRREYMPGETNI